MVRWGEIMRASIITTAFVAGMVCAMPLAAAQSASPPASGAEMRSLDEVKAEVMRRAGKINPFDSVKPEEAKQILDQIKTLDKDEWAREWCKVGLVYEAKGDELVKKGAPALEIADTFHHGFHYCMLGRYPSPTSPGKLESYHHSMRLFRKAAQYFDPPLQIVETPFADSKGRDAPARGDQLGRRRQLEGRSRSYGQSNDERGPRSALGRYARHGRKSGAL